MSSLWENTKLFKIVIIILLNIFQLTKAAPNLSQMRKSLNDDFNPIISLLCPTNEPCWRTIDDTSYIFEEAEMQEPRTQMIRGVNSETWHGTPEKLEYPEKSVQSLLPSFANRITKKDVFMSRGWGAGGLPFSVLYMNAHNSRNNNNNNNNHASNINSLESSPLSSSSSSSSSLSSSSLLKSATQLRNTAEIIPSGVGKNILQNYRVQLRNKPSNQTRRQYSIIPQLFISYGWGPHEN
ncbi:uncharacterized protein LOC127290070 [Leptopilina boulardi]|uniref:uncharacterized protein LOC127290070 n=1 Tax=Leptopilina boulardi TaxID=63433 RepID=UPI0021F5FF18|nr:uncharacterized protein LOC127290070 [Leptopilina boulardi]